MRREGRRNAPRSEQRWIGPTSYAILVAVSGAWPRLTVSSLADLLEADGWARGTVHKMREGMELRRLVRTVDGGLEVTTTGLLWRDAYPECPISVLERPQARKILRLLETKGSASTVELAAELGVHRVTTGRWLRLARDAGGPVVQEPRGPRTVWRWGGA